MKKETIEHKTRLIKDRLEYLSRYLRSISPNVSNYHKLKAEHKKLMRNLVFMKMKILR